MTTNLLILYPSIPWDAKQIRTTSAFKELQPVDNLVYGERYQHGSLDVASSWLQTISFELESNTTQTADYLAFARGDMLQSYVSQVLMQGSSSSYFAPRDVSSITSWWDANYNFFKTGSDKLIRLNDLSSNARDLAQTTDANRFTYIAAPSGINSLAAVQSTSSTQMVAAGTILISDIITNSAFTFWTVIKPISSASFMRVWRDSAAYIYLYVQSGSVALTIDDGVGRVVSKAISNGSTYIVEGRLESGTLYLSINGGSESTSVCGTIASVAGSLVLGDSSNYFDGYIGEIIFANTAVSATDRQKIRNYLIDKWVTAPRQTISSFNSASLVGPDSSDYVSKFTATSGYRYWWLTFLPTSTTYLQHSKDYFGSSFDMGIDPDYTFELFQPFSVDEVYDSGARRLGRLEKNLYRFNFIWTGVSDSKLTEFIQKICNNRDRRRFLLYTQDQHQILDSQRLVHCKLTDAKTRKTWDDYNEISATFEEVIG